MKLEFVDTTTPDMVNYIVTKGESGKATVFKFFSIINYGITLNNLMPREDVMRHLSYSLNYPDLEEQESKEFDMEYANQIISDKASFYDLMKVMSSLQDNENTDEVMIVSNYTHPVVMPIIDSLSKFIQQRYGIQTYIVNYPEDIDPYSISEFESDIGYSNYLHDIEWFYNMQKRMTNVI